MKQEVKRQACSASMSRNLVLRVTRGAAFLRCKGKRETWEMKAPVLTPNMVPVFQVGGNSRRLHCVCGVAAAGRKIPEHVFWGLVMFLMGHFFSWFLPSWANSSISSEGAQVSPRAVLTLASG